MATERARTFRIAALISYVLGYLYIHYYVLGGTKYIAGQRIHVDQWGNFVFTLLFIAGVELFTKKCGQYDGRNVESRFIAGCAVVQSLAYLIWGLHGDTFSPVQILFWHFTMVYYVLCRTGMLAAGRTGILFPLDAFQGVVTLPFGNFFLRAASVFRREDADKEVNERNAQDPTAAGTISVEDDEQRSRKIQNAVVLGISIFAAVIVVLIAWNELAGASKSFNRFGSSLGDWLSRAFGVDFVHRLMTEYLPEFLISLPVSAWLFGLVGGSLKREKVPCTYEEFQEKTRSFHVFPPRSAYIVIGALIAVYALFFIVSSGELVQMLTARDLSSRVQAAGGAAYLEERVSVYEASRVAVSGFWQLVRIVILNFAVLTGFCLCSDVPLWERKATRRLVTVLFVFAAMFALLAGFKLFGLYLILYGPTQKRILSGWMITMLLLFIILTLIRFYRRIPAVRIGILTAAASFSVLCMLNIERICSMM